jgi:hypothetical protein
MLPEPVAAGNVKVAAALPPTSPIRSILPASAAVTATVATRVFILVSGAILLINPFEIIL